MAVAITNTVVNSADSSRSGAVATYSSQSTGTATADRLVVLCVSSELASGTITSATYDSGGGDTAMTAGSQGTFGNNSARIFYALVTTGTTATFKVTFGANPTATSSHIPVFGVTGADTSVISQVGNATSTDMDATAPLTLSTFIPINGGFIATASCATDTVGKTWVGATEAADVDGGDMRHTTASTTTGGATTVTCTGGTNLEDGGLSFIVFRPLAPTFGACVGTATNALASITNPFPTSAAIGVAIGDLVVVAVCEQTAQTATTCSDGLANTYTALTAADVGNATLKGWYSLITVAGQATPSVVTTASADDAGIVASAFAGPFTATPLDINPAVSAADSSEPYSATATGTLAQADELIVGYFGSSPAETYDTPAPSATINVQSSTAVAATVIITSLVVAATTTITMEISGVTGTRQTACGVATFKKGSANKSLTVDAGAFTFSGTAATLKVGHKLTAASGAWNFTGTAVTLRKNIPLAAGTGSFLFTGTAATLRVAHKLTAASGSFAFTGTAATLRHGYKTVAAAGTFNFTGTSASFRRTYILTAASGSWNFSGTAASLLHGWKLAAGSGSFAFNGSDATLTKSTAAAKVLSAASGSFAFSGTAASLRVNHRLDAGAGDFRFTGSDLTHVFPILDENGAPLLDETGDVIYDETSYETQLRVDRRLTAGSGSFLFSGTAASLRVGHNSLVAASGAFNFSGTAASLKIGYRLTAASGAWNFTGSDATLTKLGAKVLPADSGSFLFTGSPVTLTYVPVVVVTPPTEVPPQPGGAGAPVKQPGRGPQAPAFGRSRELKEFLLPVPPQQVEVSAQPPEPAEAERAAPELGPSPLPGVVALATPVNLATPIALEYQLAQAIEADDEEAIIATLLALDLTE